MPPMAATAVTTDSITRCFAIACGVLGHGQYVNDDAPAAVVQERNASVGRAHQLTIFYGGKVVVLDGCTPARAAELIRYTAAAAEGAPEQAPVDMPIARKASLRRFLAKRKDRAAAAATVPYGRPEQAPAKNGKTEARSEEASSWLALGSLGDMHARCDHLNITL